jgi:acyl-CoA synthetase (AMP-forming)/AMP-acid ligase II
MKYNGWPLLDVIPSGWAIDNTCGSPLSGYVFITNRKSVLNGQQRALLRIKKENEYKELVEDKLIQAGITVK